jgi:hypothetical protein
VQYKICLLLLDLEMEDVVPELFRMLLSQRITRCGAAITPLPSRVSALSCPTAWAVGRGCCERSEGEGGGERSESDRYNTGAEVLEVRIPRALPTLVQRRRKIQLELRDAVELAV